MNNKLEKARSYEREYLEGRTLETMEDRPLFHATGTVGWINDPNGFSIYQGKYHLFYQYYPFDTHWGPMYWGHSVSKDLVKWEYLPCALAPDQGYDKDGCFSGSAIELEDGKQLLMYTGVLDGYQQQCIAIGDGIDYEKVSENPVISTAMIPDGNDTHDFRDPKVIRQGDKFYCFAVNRNADNSGQVFVYESSDVINWSFNKTLDKCNNELGVIWECPDYFQLQDKKVLIVSPQEVEGVEGGFYPGFNNFFLIGTGSDFLDFTREAVQQIDFGPDFYAAQTLETPDGRRVLIAWMQNWETKDSGNELHDYFGMMTLVRELTIKEGHIYQNPVRELSNYYGKAISYEKVRVFDEQCIEGISGRAFDMTLEIEPENDCDYQFSVELAKGRGHKTVIAFDSANSSIRLDRTCSGARYSALSTKEFKVELDGGRRLKMRIVLDKYAMELFVNDGRQAAAMKLDTPLKDDQISFNSSEPALVNITKHDFSF